MDNTDKKILTLLQQDAKQNIKEIASQVGLSVTPTYERIKKLEKKGFIKKYVALLDGEKINKNVTVYCQVSLDKHSRTLIDDFKKAVDNFPQVMACYHVTGNSDFVLKIVMDDMNQYHRFIIDELATIKGISNLQSSIVIQEVKNDTAFVL